MRRPSPNGRQSVAAVIGHHLHGAAGLALAVTCAVLIGIGLASPAEAGPPPTSPAPVVAAFPVAPVEEAGEEDDCGDNDFCLIGDFLFGWIGDAAGEVALDAWTSAMTAMWAAGLWVLGLAFSVIDALTTPDLSADGPLAQVYPITFGIGAALVILMALIQIGVAAFRRDGQSLGKVAIGVCQFGLVWAGYVGTVALLVTGVAGLTTGLLRGLLGIDTLAAFDTTSNWPEEITDPVVATVLGFSAIFLLFPASVAYLLLMLVREAALMLLAATSAISAGGLTAETSSAWFWKSLRWFIAALLIAPMAVLVLGIGVTITEGVVGGGADDIAAEVGTAVVGCLLIAIGAVCPLVLFKLLAFVDPGTSSGVAMRQSLAASGGVTGLLSRKLSGGQGGGQGAGSSAGSGASTKVAGGRAQGESSADAATQSRFGAAVSGLGTGSAKLGQLAAGAAAVGSDLLSGAGVGHQAPYYGQPAASRGATPGGDGPAQTGSSQEAEPPPPPAADGGPPPQPPPDPPAPPDPTFPRPPSPVQNPAETTSSAATIPQPGYRPAEISRWGWKADAAGQRPVTEPAPTGGAR